MQECGNQFSDDIFVFNVTAAFNPLLFGILVKVNVRPLWIEYNYLIRF